MYSKIHSSCIFKVKIETQFYLHLYYVSILQYPGRHIYAFLYPPIFGLFNINFLGNDNFPCTVIFNDEILELSKYHRTTMLKKNTHKNKQTKKTSTACSPPPHLSFLKTVRLFKKCLVYQIDLNAALPLATIINLVIWPVLSLKVSKFFISYWKRRKKIFKEMCTPEILPPMFNGYLCQK